MQIRLDADTTRALVQTAESTPGPLMLVFLHDDWCTKLNGLSTCNCHPDLEIAPCADVIGLEN